MADPLGELRARLQTLKAENKELRRLLWLRHGCFISALYGDDGEMSCGACIIDFKRAPAADIGAVWRHRAMDNVRRFVEGQADTKRGPVR